MEARRAKNPRRTTLSAGESFDGLPEDFRVEVDVLFGGRGSI
jgi:hypothetical protein